MYQGVEKIGFVFYRQRGSLLPSVLLSSLPEKTSPGLGGCRELVIDLETD